MTTDTAADDRWTEAKVFDALRHPWPDGSHVRLCAVRNGTGFSRKKVQTADGIIFSTWPSRGLWMAGVEIKVSRADWKRELADPHKSADIQQYCHYWYVAAPKGLIPAAEVPESWGLVEVELRTAKIAKAAPRLEPKPPDFLMVCSIFRAIADKTTPTAIVDEMVRRALDEERDRLKETKNTPRDYELKRLKECVEKFEQASGVTIAHQWDVGQIGEAVKLIRTHGAEEICKRLRRDAERAKTVAEKMLSELSDVEKVTT